MSDHESVPFWSIFAPELAEAIEKKYRAELEREKINALAEFAAGAGHEINNPLAIIGGRAQLLMREISNPDHQKHLASILTQVKRAYEMIADIRVFARPPQLKPQNVDVAELLCHVVAKYSEMTSETAIKTINNADTSRQFAHQIVWDTHNIEPCEPMWLDPVQLQLVFEVLCKNCVEALSFAGISDGRIKLSCKPHLCRATETQSTIIKIEDNGPGVPPEHLPLIFSPYFSGRQAGRGLGFGLPKAWRLLEQMQCTIAAEPVLPRGACFVVTLKNQPIDLDIIV